MISPLWLVAIMIWLLAAATTLSIVDIDRGKWLAGIIWLFLSFVAMWSLVYAIGEVLP